MGRSLRFPGGALRLDRGTLLMGVLNVTPDSFSDGGKFSNSKSAVAQGFRMRDDGAAIVDVGGESTRPGSKPVAAAVELRRTIPVVEKLAARGVVVSIDTQKAAVAREALAAGAKIVNDVSALRGDLDMAGVVAESGAAVVLMHMRGTPRTMQRAPRYRDVVADVARFLRERKKNALRAGIAADRIVIDPGIGFGKTLEHNLELLRRLGEFRRLGAPILVGPSKKRFLGAVTGRPVGERAFGTAAAVAVAALRGADLLRVHDVREMADVVRLIDRLR